MDPLRVIFQSFKFQDDESWIEKAFTSGFTDFEDVPADTLSILSSPETTELVRRTRTILKKRMAPNKSERERISWRTLVDLDADVGALSAILGYLIKRGQASDAEESSRLACTRATSLYLVLLSVPGSNAFRAFDPSLYDAALETLTLLRRSEFRAESRNDALTAALNGVLYDLVVMLESFSVSLEARSLDTTVRRLVETTKLTDETINEYRPTSNGGNSSFATLTTSLSYNASVALYRLCDPKYAPIETIVMTIAKYELEHLSDCANLSTKRATVVGESSLGFFKTLVERHGDAARSSVVILIQHLMMKCPERQEGRRKLALVVVKFMDLLRGNGTTSSGARSFFDRSLSDLILFSHHAKTACRVFAQEIIGKLLMELTGKNGSDAPTRRIKKILLGCALGQCVDISSSVRGRAIATLAEYTEPTIDDQDARDVFRARPGETGDGDDERDMPSLQDLERILADDDASPDFVLPNAKALVRILRERSEDERALVRRSALQSIGNGVAANPRLLDEAMPIVGLRCRDSTLTVRRFAIRLLTDFLEAHPDNPNIHRCWVESVVPRLFDPEAKVQEEVLKSLERVTIAKINNHDSSTAVDDDSPWKILEKLAADKMTDHLVRACDIWVRDKSITNETIGKIESHVSTERNNGAWLLLASMAHTGRLSNMERYYDYYERALVDDENDDGFSANLILRVLQLSWRSFDTETLKKLERRLAETLEKFQVRVALIARSLDILNDITKRLESNDDNPAAASIIRNLAKLSDTTIAARVVESETDDSGRVIFRAICTFGHASFLCTEKISLSSLLILQGLLVKRNRLPNWIKKRKELQGAAIAALGQQALRDRDIARDITPIFGRLLRNATEGSDGGDDDNMANGPAVRINAAKALADIFGRFTALVEPFLPDMCISMKDDDPEVRRVILVIFIQLLVEDFIKINGAFFFHIMTMLTDSDETIRQMTVFLINERLLTKNRSLVTRQLVNALFHYNDCERGFDRRLQRKMSDRERTALTLPGQINASKRRLIYDFMLRHLDSPEKLKILLALTKQIFDLRESRTVELADAASWKCEKIMCVVRDALYIASSELLKPNLCSGQNVEDENLEDSVVSQSQNSTIQSGGNASGIADAMKKHRLRVLVPNLVELKRRAARAKSPLASDFAKFLIRTISDYNEDQLAGLYKEYPNLDKELERDSRKYENATQVGEEDERVPIIVLRRISTLTYPWISGQSSPTRSPSTSRESSQQQQPPDETVGRRSIRQDRKSRDVGD